MAASEAEDLVRRYVDDVWNRGDLDSLDALTAASFAYHLNGQPARDRQAVGGFVMATRQAFPDWRVDVDQTIADSSSVAVRWHGRVTHLGPFRGIAPTGRTIVVTGISLYTIHEGKIASEWEQTDSLGMLQQLGVLNGRVDR
jgi:steroid delta-isomerase-like uncharacterized protein